MVVMVLSPLDIFISGATMSLYFYLVLGKTLSLQALSAK